jgi:hypothetical protein
MSRDVVVAIVERATAPGRCYSARLFPPALAAAASPKTATQTRAIPPTSDVLLHGHTLALLQGLAGKLHHHVTIARSSHTAVLPMAFTGALLLLRLHLPLLLKLRLLLLLLLLMPCSCCC